MAWLVDKRRPEWVRKLGRRLATKKVDLSRRVIRRANRKARVESHFSVMEKPEVVAANKDCDFIFPAADGHSARRLYKQLLHQYLILGVQIWTSIQVDLHTGAEIHINDTTQSDTTSTGRQLGKHAVSQARSLTKSN